MSSVRNGWTPSVTTCFQCDQEHMKKPWSEPNDPTTDPCGFVRAGKPKKAIEQAQYSASAGDRAHRVSRKRTGRKRRGSRSSASKRTGGPIGPPAPGPLAAYS